ncbi:MAG TPA: LamG-like jellyroll fold domain-containing protein, partial [Ktedonobacterales bacterium]
TIAVSAWLKPAAQGQQVNQLNGLALGGWYFARRDPGVSEGFSAAIQSDNSILVILRTSLLGPNGEYFHSAAGAVTSGQWQNVVVTAATGDTVRAYVNSTPVAMSPLGASDPATLGGPLYGASHVWFGQRQYSNTAEGAAGGAHFAGSVDDIRVFNSTSILAPTIHIDSPTASSYPHDGSLSISYAVNDGTGVGAQSSSASIDSTLTVTSGQVLNLLTSLGLGSHTLTVNAVDYLGRTTSQSVTFTVVVTPASITDDVNQFVSSGQISDPGVAQSLLAKLAAAQRARTNGDCNTAGNIYQALINELQAQNGIGVDPTAASIMTADAQYLIAHCP